MRGASNQVHDPDKKNLKKRQLKTIAHEEPTMPKKGHGGGGKGTRSKKGNETRRNSLSERVFRPLIVEEVQHENKRGVKKKGESIGRMHREHSVAIQSVELRSRKFLHKKILERSRGGLGRVGGRKVRVNQKKGIGSLQFAGESNIGAK